MTNPVRLAAVAAASSLLAAAPVDPATLPPLNVVWFAGGGGSSEGMREAGFAPDYALNHNATALWMHQVNHPDCTHLCDDATAVHPMTLEPGRPIRAFWASPDCTHFSVARGGAPKSPRIRGLAWCIIPWAKLRRPTVIFIENVKEFETYGPLHPEGHPRAGHPIKQRAGETFQRFIRRLRQCGYEVEWKVLCAADYGAPTTRRRLFIMARCDGQPIVWPERTHAPRRDAARLGLLPYESAASIIDWTERCPSIFMSAAEAKGEGLKVKRPLVRATLSRIAKGIERYVVGSPDPFIVPITHSGERRVPSATEPLATITSAHRGEFAVASPTLALVTKFQENSIGSDPAAPVDTVMAGATRFGVVEASMQAANLVGLAHGDDAKSGRRDRDVSEPLKIIGAQGGDHAVVTSYLVPSYGERAGQQPRTGSVEQPYPTVVPGGNGGHLVAVHMGRQFGASVGSAAGEPIGSVMPGGSGKTQLVAATLGRQFGSNIGGTDIRDAAPTIMSEGGGGKLSVISANLTSYYGTGGGSDVADPLRTVTGEDRFGLTAAFLEQANTGMVGHDLREGVSTITGRATQQRLIEARLQAIGAAPDSRRRAVLHFLWDHFGEPSESDWADPTGTAQARLRFGLVIIDGAVWEIADIGMRMLKVRELFSAQGFRRSYIIDLDPWGRPITATSATLMVGNSVPPPLARVLAAANLPAPEPELERVAA